MVIEKNRIACQFYTGEFGDITNTDFSSVCLLCFISKYHLICKSGVTTLKLSDMQHEEDLTTIQAVIQIITIPTLALSNKFLNFRGCGCAIRWFGLSILKYMLDSLHSSKLYSHPTLLASDASN